jgi:hypothetical protein
MTPSIVPDTSADPVADVAPPTRSGPSLIVDPPPLDTPVHADIDETAPLRAAVHALRMHATIHGIADWERTLHDGSPPTTVADELHALIAAQAPRHQAIADAAHQLAAAVRAVVDGLDQTRPTRIHGLPRHDAAGHPALTALHRQTRELLHAHRWLLPELHAVLDNLPLDHPDPTPTRRPIHAGHRSSTTTGCSQLVGRDRDDRLLHLGLATAARLR